MKMVDLAFADAREPGFVLGDEDVVVVWGAVGGPGDERDGNRQVGGDGDVRGEFVAVGDFGGRSLGMVLGRRGSVGGSWLGDEFSLGLHE